MRALPAFVALAISACSQRSEPTARGSTGEAPPKLRWPGAFPLLVSGREGGESYLHGRMHWRTATTSFARGHYERSAHEFLEVAFALSESAEEGDGTFRSIRCFAYENAASAWMAAGAAESGRMTLAALEAKDSGCRRSIALLVDRLSEEASR